MADDVAITAGAGTNIATDDCTSGHVQLMKIAYSADGNRTHVTADADGLLVNLGTNNDVTVTSISAGDNNIGNVDIVTVPAPLSTTGGGTEATALRVTVASDSTGVLSVDDNGGALTVDNAGTFAVQVDGSALTALQLIDDTVFADDAAFTVGTSKVQAMGGYAVAHGSAPDAADVGDAGIPLMNRHRVLWTIGGHPNIVTLKHTNITTAVTDTAIITISTGSKIAVTRLTVTLDSASTVFPTVLIGFGSTTTPTTTGVLAAHGGVPAGGGFTIGDGSGVLGVGADGEDLRITTTGNATGNGLQVTCSYFLIES